MGLIWTGEEKEEPENAKLVFYFYRGWDTGGSIIPATGSGPLSHCAYSRAKAHLNDMQREQELGTFQAH